MIGIKKIAIDVSPTLDANSKRGVGFYTKNLVESLQKEVKSNPDYQNFSIDLIENCKFKIENYSLVHYPYFDPFKLTLPVKKIPTIITVHDLIPRQFKAHFPVGLKGEIKWLIQKNRLKKADYIITDSHTSKYIIADITKYPVDKIYTIYLAASSLFKPIIEKKILQKIKKKYQLPDKFVLYVGDINWNKNIPRLVNACLDLKYPLVIVGTAATRKNVENHPWNQDLLWLQSIALKYQSTRILTLPGFVPDADLVSIYNLATLYCQPSIAEGFGLPVLEAMACGCPVSYSLTSSLEEIVDYNGQPFNPTSTTSIKKAIKTVWTNPVLQDKLSQKGLKHSQTFSWRQAALQTLAVYKLALLNEK